MADEHRTSLGAPIPASAEETDEEPGAPALPAPVSEPGAAEAMRELLPAIEPERRLNDWGRSERIEDIFDRTLLEFFYRYWFRAEVEGIENVPSDRGALLVSNHAGALPPDAAMIAKAIREEHPYPRPLYLTVEHFFKGYPGFSMLIPKIGGVAAHPANVHRLLCDERQLVLVFPEGRKGTEKLYRDRYRLRRFGRGGFVEAAMRAEAQIVPTCVVGAEEAMPAFGQVDFLRRLTGLIYFPITPTFPWLGPLGMLGYLPAKFRIRFLEPIDTVELGGAEAVEDKALVQTLAQEIRARIQESLHEMLAQEKVGLVRMSAGGPSEALAGLEAPRDEGSRRVLVTGLSTYWGGRLAQALESFEHIEAIIGVDNKAPKHELERTEFVKVSNQHSLLQRIVRAAEIDTVIDTRLVVNSLMASPRAAHENNVIGTMNILAACTGADSPVRKFVFKSSTHYYGSEQDDPAFFTERMRRPHAPHSALERDMVEAEQAVNDFAERNRDVTTTVLRCANVLGPDVDTAFTRMFRFPLVPMVLGFDPRLQFVHEDDVVHALEHAAFHVAPGIYNVAADGVLALSEIIGLLGKRPLPVLPPWGTGLVAGPLRRLGFRIPDEVVNQLRFGRGVDNRLLKATGFRYGYTTRESVLNLGEHLRLASVLRGVERTYTYEREVEEFLRWSPYVRREHSGERRGVAADRDPLGI